MINSLLDYVVVNQLEFSVYIYTYSLILKEHMLVQRKFGKEDINILDKVVSCMSLFA